MKIRLISYSQPSEEFFEVAIGCANEIAKIFPIIKTYLGE